MNATGIESRTIAGRYRLTEQLGRGGMGSVWRAEDLTLGSPVAVKLIDPELAIEESVRARFYHEAKAAAALRSPHVVQILDYGVDAGVPFIAMELLEGETLADRLARVRVLPAAELGRIFADVARAVRKAHEAGVVHRDLKPDNVFLVRNDDQELAKVLDFGIAKAAPAVGMQSRQTRTGALIGTPPYMSPEQARGAAVDHRSDLWSLGVIVFECLCGRLPFLADTPGELVLQICAYPVPVPSAVARRVPAGLDAWMDRALARDPAARFQSAREMADALRPVLVPVSMGPQAAPDPGAPSSPQVSLTGEARPGTLNGGAAFVSGTSPRPRVAASRLAAILSGTSLLLAAGLGIFWLTRSPSLPASPGVGPSVTDTMAAGTPSPVVTPGETVQPAPPVSATPSVRPAAPRAAESAPRPAEPATPADPAKPAEAAAPRPTAAPAAKPADPAKPAEPPKKKDRIGW